MVYKLTTVILLLSIYTFLSPKSDPIRQNSFHSTPGPESGNEFHLTNSNPISLGASWIVPSKRNCGARNPATRYPEEQLRRNHHFLVRYFILSCAVPFIPYSSG
ncbi:hypothetical protein TNIN_453881 [Trichonephila inaurata madagascariensis]|uniref:Uncharacterized protein n=1 Tax=Trichonephila inaurata madagascariensis TaxID=2747483 RepID=A0A8X7C0D8_9ARAC|nr:hypothetical protein TNIN_453881 [Trichonephila inaurata madagascariensis]